MIHHISSDHIGIGDLDKILTNRATLVLGKNSITDIEKCRNYLDNKTDNTDELFYGINTGFGSLCNIKISDEQTEQLQKNLVMSHACGTGELVPKEVVKIMLLLKIQGLSYGYSAAQLITINRLIDFFNNDVLPVVYQQGSLGASGDLAPLAHLALPLIGLGEVFYKGERLAASVILKKMNWQPIRLKSKEGLALLNGTQFSNAYSVWSMIKAKRLWKLANLTAAVSLDAFNCRRSPFDVRLHTIRPHKGQATTAKTILQILEGSEVAKLEKKHVQDPYAFRCIPQVHGASYDALDYIERVVTTEVNSVTDNPTVFPESDAILSGGNFHAQPLALVLDHLAIALAELGSISERRTYQLISGIRDLPAFLAADPGLNSGLMIPQYTAASIVSQNKQYCTPASVDSIVSSNGQEDHVSMAANAATKAYKVVENIERLLAIEFMTAMQALDFRKPTKSSPMIETLRTSYRKVVPFLEQDRVLSTDIHETIIFLRTISVE